MNISDTTLMIPQANNLDALRRAFEAIQEGSTSTEDIASKIGYTNRQGHYYRTALECLGFISVEQKQVKLTALGKKYSIAGIPKGTKVGVTEIDEDNFDRKTRKTRFEIVVGENTIFEYTATKIRTVSIGFDLPFPHQEQRIKFAAIETRGAI